MSSIAFHTKEKTLRVSGAERGLFGTTVADFAYAALGIDTQKFDFALWFWPEDASRIKQSENLYLRGHTKTRLAVGEMGLSTARPRFNWWYAQLNTAIAIGGDPLKLAARLHAGCEIHAWIAEQDRHWFANIVAKSREVGFLRDWNAYDGWSAIIKMMRDESIPGDVFTSYSVTETFPRADYCGWEYDEEAEERGENDPWDYMDQLGKDVVWSRNVAWMKESAHPALQISPDNWSDHQLYGPDNAMTIKAEFDEYVRGSAAAKQLPA